MAHKLSRENWYDKTKLTLSSYQHYLTPLMLKLCRKSVDLSPKSFLWTSTQPFATYLQCLPRDDPGSLCANTRIHLGSITRYPADFGAITCQAKTLCYPLLDNGLFLSVVLIDAL